MPKTVLGKWSVGLIIAFFLFFGLLLLLVASGQRGGETFFSNPYLAFAGVFAAISATGSFFAGLASIIKNKEMSVLVILSTAIGLLVLWFVLGEFLYPH